ncbi:stressosome-associated protein Prli42 [Anoxybacteroides tepidamans]|nr:stressosome-associated protein Prli42 [Anoxybacillus tepidamans]
MSRKKTQKIVVYLMLGSMILTTILTGISMWF